MTLKQLFSVSGHVLSGCVVVSQHSLAKKNEKNSNGGGENGELQRKMGKRKAYVFFIHK